MSTELNPIKDTGKNRDALMKLTEFFGGKRGGVMLQVTQGLGARINLDTPGFIQLTTLDAYKLIIAISEWLQKTSESKASELSERISQDKVLQKTVLKDAVECQRFIASLKLLEIPLRLLQ